MNKVIHKWLLLAILLAAALAHPHVTASCPSASSYSTLVHDHLVISNSGNVLLQSGVDAICYTYTLPAPFLNKPGVAIAVRHMQAQSTMDIFYSIRSTKTDSLTTINFLVRTQWKYTSWLKFDITFIAEDQSNIEANIFNVDTANLAGCGQSRDVRVMLPFRTPNFAPIKALTFINGFQISSIQTSNGNSPFEVQITNLILNVTGLALSVTATSATKVFNVFISLVAYDATLQGAYGSGYEYTTYFPTPSLTTTTPYPLGNNTLDFYGISGFIITNVGSSFLYTTSFTNSNFFSFATSSNFQYLNFNYFFISGLPCANCNGYPLYYSGVCYNSCPQGTYLNGTTCITCPQGQQWNGNACIAMCYGGQVYNPSTGSCQCPSGLYWTGSTCIACTGGQIWNSQTNQCSCQNGLYWNGNACIQCTGGQYWNATINACACPAGSQWNGAACINIPICYGGQVYNPSSGSCQCPSGTYWTGSTCITCSNGQYWNSQTNSCTCPSGQYWNGTYCQTCPIGQIWNSQTNSCNCPSGQYWNGTCCLSCANGQVWNPQTNSCSCPSNQYWNGTSCISCANGQYWNPQTNSCNCPSGQFWNGYSCISCPAGQYWNSQTNVCSCPSGQYWNGFNCITCDGGRVWNYQTNACQCQSGLNWNGSQCVACPAGQYWTGYVCVSCIGGQVWCNITLNCQCQPGYQWNGTNCIVPCPAGQVSINGICSCPSGYYMVNGICQLQPNCPFGTNWNGSSCVPISCPPGTYWNGSICATQTSNCPAGTYWDGYCCSASTTTCPSGTYWNGYMCVTNVTQCPQGSYWTGSSCQPMQCQCPAGMNWVNGQCVPTGNNCPTGTYLSGQTCVPFTPCTGGRIWNSQLSQCVCPPNSFWNGNTCFNCGNGQLYEGNVGCYCPNGTYFDGSRCTQIPNNQCSNIPNSIWSGNQCICNTGYVLQGLSCVCYGLESNGYCDRCYQKPNSEWKYGICQCSDGYYESNGQCLPIQVNPNPPSTTPSCNVATFFDNQQKRCLPCSDGCLSCSTCYSCTQCRPQYNFCTSSGLCTQICGDGKRFSLACDDGNNVNGDGCSSDCKIEVGYNCIGGSPNSKDACTTFRPSAISITQSGQSHLMNKIILNVRVNYLPQQLIKSAVDCKNNCNGVLNVSIIRGFNSFVSIKSSYIPTTTYSFSIQIDFGREPIGIFTAQVGIQSGIALKYFSGIDTTQKLIVQVNPAFMSVYTGPKNYNDKGRGRKNDEDRLH